MHTLLLDVMFLSAIGLAAISYRIGYKRGWNASKHNSTRGS